MDIYVLPIAGALGFVGIFAAMLYEYAHRRPHEWSEEFEIGGGETTHGDYTFVVARRRLKICVNCLATDAMTAVKPWCTYKGKDYYK